MHKVSFIVPIYNVEKYLRRCLDSIKSQTFQDWEAICVNDGSPDSSKSILEEYAASDSRFVVVDKPNGGLSDARNAGMAVADGEYVVYVDSDDFIHPQTLEIALSVQRRSGADIVSWYKDNLFRIELAVRYFLNLDNTLYTPRNYKKKYSPESVSYHYTEDVLSVATEESHPEGIKHPLKHCYVWRHLIRRSLISDLDFVKGLSFEDFPWWSSVLLRNPKVAYTYLPLYFYYFNPGSIDVSSARLKKVASWVRGLEVSCGEYALKGSDRQKENWSRSFKWPVIRIHIARFLPRVSMENEYAVQILEGLTRLKASGAFDDPVTEMDRRNVKMISELIDRFNRAD